MRNEEEGPRPMRITKRLPQARYNKTPEKTMHGRLGRMLRKEKPELIEKQKGVKIKGTQEKRSEDFMRRN